MNKLPGMAKVLIASLTLATLLTGCSTTSFFGNPSLAKAESLSPNQQTHRRDVASKDKLLQTGTGYKISPIPDRFPPSYYVNLNKDIYYTNRVMIISFHDMSLHQRSRYNTSPQAFAADLQALQAYHFNVISHQQFIDWKNNHAPVPANAVMLTFDDGYRSMYSHAFPILRQYHMTGTFFIITHAPDVNYHGFVTWPELQVMAQQGMTLESHTYNLHFDVNVHGKLIPAFNTPYWHGKLQTPSQYYQRDYQDFLQARLQLQQHLGYTVDEIAWPYGYGNAIAYRAALAAGYQMFYTTAAGVNSPWTSSWYIKRIDVGLAKSPVQMINEILRTAGSPSQLVAQPQSKTSHQA
ncbi:MAG: hypothetical protein A2201_09025 [Alicyclobacillus sp. RIFOXYA1_FULL_53_8]|nr:MAG: hypothetical protein A2201_09025 [Alicyclobacillus sp. RIFOXYA1_FULL_53_8]